MNYPITGYHHMTSCAGGAQEDVDFCTGILGLRMVKQTILMDGMIPIYHLYYSNANAEPGSVMTSFPYKRKPGRRGSGQTRSIAYTVSKGTLPFWKEHLKRHNVDCDPVQERFGQSFIRFTHPAGLMFEMIEDPNDKRQGWTTDKISQGEAAHGFHGAVLSVREVDEQTRFLTDALGFRKTGTDGKYHRFEIGAGGANRTVTLLHEPDLPAGTWTFGAGTVHHVAMWCANDDALLAQKAIYEELGYTDASEIKDRFYFHSMYVRSPGGILVECCCNVPGSFTLDESPEHLGEKLHLPPWVENRRDEIIASLEPIKAPEQHVTTNRGH